MNFIFEQFDYRVRYVFAAIAVIILLRCIFSLFRSRPRRETLATLLNLADDTKIDIENWETSVGRSRACDISLKNYSTVSRFHAVLALRKGGWYIFDTDSKTGVYVNGEKIEHSSRVESGDTVSFGNAVMKFSSNVFGVNTHEEDGAVAPKTDFTSAARLINMYDNSAFYIRTNCLIGRDKHCNIILPVESISPQHAQIYLTKAGWVVADLNDVSKTYLNGDIVLGSYPLYDGDIITMGDYRFMFRE